MTTPRVLAVLLALCATACGHARRPRGAVGHGTGVDSATEAQASERFLARMATEDGARRLPSGVVIVPLRPGHGASPRRDGTATIRYQARRKDGSTLEAQDGPVTVLLAKAPPCWRDALAEMHVGERARVGCPSRLVVEGEEARGRVLPGGVVVFEFELVDAGRPLPAPGH